MFGDELSDPAAFTALPFDHLIFTGSPRVGRIVMAAAAQNLVPVTLELGGKSPAIVAPDYDVDDAALRITHGKAAMSGQICVAPDYVLVPEAKVAQFVAQVKASFQRFFPDGTEGREEYCSLINDRHTQRIRAMLDDAREKGATVIPCAPWESGNRVPLHIVTGVTPDMQIAQEEVFGPILPVLSYRDFAEAIAYVGDQPCPLALYLFSTVSASRDRVLAETRSGGVTINDWGWHVVNAAVPFGGVGNSGFGSYHGVEGFRELSNPRPVFTRATVFPTQMMYPPLDVGPRGLFQRFWLNRYSKKPDPNLGGTRYGESLERHDD